MSRYGDVPLLWVLFWGASEFLGTFLGYSRIFRYHLFLVKFDFIRKNPDFWVLILIYF